MVQSTDEAGGGQTESVPPAAYTAIQPHTASLEQGAHSQLAQQPASSQFFPDPASQLGLPPRLTLTPAAQR